MDQRVNVLVLKVKGKGCKGCIAPSKRLFLNVKGVKGVQILGYLVAIIYDENVASPSKILSKSNVHEFYNVEVVSTYSNMLLSDVRRYLEKLLVFP